MKIRPSASAFPSIFVMIYASSASAEQSPFPLPIAPRHESILICVDGHIDPRLSLSPLSEGSEAFETAVISRLSMQLSSHSIQAFDRKNGQNRIVKFRNYKICDQNNKIIVKISYDGCIDNMKKILSVTRGLNRYFYKSLKVSFPKNDVHGVDKIGANISRNLIDDTKEISLVISDIVKGKEK